MRNILVIGLNTFREAIRNKILYSLLFFAVLVIVGSLAFGALSVHEEARLTLDLGLGGMSIFSVIIAIFVGVNLVYKELERKTVYTLIPKPIRRYEFVLGKFVGLAITLLVQVAIMTVVLLAVLSRVEEAEIGAPVFMMISLIYLEVMVVTAVAVLFSSFSSPFLSGAFTAGVFLLGRSVPDIRQVADKLGERYPPLEMLLDGIARVVPNLRHLYVSGAEVAGEHVTVHGVFIDWAYVGQAALYAGAYAAAVLVLASVLFSRRDFV